MRRFLPSLSSLQAFEASARHLNFTNAADDLGVTQSGISRQIKTLESYLGITLFERNGSRLILTDIGKTYAHDVRKSLDKLEESSIDVVRGRKADVEVLVGCIPTLASRWLSPRLTNYADQNPDRVLEVVQASNDVNFEDSNIDIAVLRGDGPWTSAISYELLAEQIAVVASPELVPTRIPLQPRDFSDFRLLQNATRPSFWLQWIRAADIDYRGSIQGPRFGHTGMLINAVTSGLGIGVVPTILVENELRSGALHCPFGPPVPSGESYFVVYPERKAHLGSVKTFRDWILGETRHLRTH